MARRLFVFLFLWMCLFNSSYGITAPVYELGVYDAVDEPRIDVVVKGTSIIVYGAEGLTIEIVSLTGKLVTRSKIESMSQSLELNIPKGCYILKIGKYVRKVSIQ